MTISKYLALFILLSAILSGAQSPNCPAALAEPSLTADLQFFDEPHFIVAGITDNTYRGGHGSGAVLGSSETLVKAAAALPNPTPSGAPEDPHHKAAIEAEHAGNPLEAVKELQRAAELSPNEPNLFDWAAELLAHDAPQAAARVFTNGVRLYPQSLRMLLGLASAWYSAGCYDQAATYFFKAADLAPADPTPYSFLSKVQRTEIKNAPGYLDRMARFVKLRPDNALANYYYGVAIWNYPRKSEDPEVAQQARDLLERAAELDPDLAPAYLELGIIFAGEREYEKASLALQKAIDINPDLEEAHYRLSEAYRVIGELIKSQQELAIYHRLSTHSAQELERERQDLQRFVISLRGQIPEQTKHVQ